MHCFVLYMCLLYCAVRYRYVLYSTVQVCTVQYCTVQVCTVLYFTVWFRYAQYNTGLKIKYLFWNKNIYSIIPINTLPNGYFVNIQIIYKNSIFQTIPLGTGTGTGTGSRTRSDHVEHSDNFP